MKKSIISITTLLSCILLTACSFSEKNVDSSSKKEKVSLIKEKSSSHKAKTKSTSKVMKESSSLSSSSSNSSSSSLANNNSSSSESTDSEMSFDEAARLIEKGGFADFHYELAQDFHEGSHPTNDGGYVMITYPGAKGIDIFTITKVNENKYHIEAKYGTLDGGKYTEFPSDNNDAYSLSSADVTK